MCPPQAVSYILGAGAARALSHAPGGLGRLAGPTPSGEERHNRRWQQYTRALIILWHVVAVLLPLRVCFMLPACSVLRSRSACLAGLSGFDMFLIIAIQLHVSCVRKQEVLGMLRAMQNVPVGLK